MIYYIDLFSGAGGTSTGIHLAGSKVVACVNHDSNAIKSHKANHPEAVNMAKAIANSTKHSVNRYMSNLKLEIA